jgi:hypothetical protein
MWLFDSLLEVGLQGVALTCNQLQVWSLHVLGTTNLALCSCVFPTLLNKISAFIIFHIGVGIIVFCLVIAPCMSCCLCFK